MDTMPAHSTLNVQASSDRYNRLLGIFCALIVVVLFSGFTLVSRLGFSSSLTLIDIAALRFAIGGTLLLPVFLHYGLAGIRWREAAGLAFLGGAGFALFAYTGFSLAPASHGAVLLHGTLPLFTFGFVRIASGSSAKSGQALGLGMILLGVVAMAWDSVTGTSGRQLLGDASLLLASACWSAYGVQARRIGVKPAHAASMVAVLSMCCFLPVYMVMPGKALFLVDWHEILLQGLFQGVLIGGFSIFIYTRAVASLGAIETALFTAAVPCVTTIAALLLLGEIPSMIAWGGVAIVTVGMIVAMRA